MTSKEEDGCAGCIMFLVLTGLACLLIWNIADDYKKLKDKVEGLEKTIEKISSKEGSKT